MFGEGIPDMDRTAWNEIAAALKMSKRLKALENPQTGVMKPYTKEVPLSSGYKAIFQKRCKE